MSRNHRTTWQTRRDYMASHRRALLALLPTTGLATLLVLSGVLNSAQAANDHQVAVEATTDLQSSEAQGFRIIPVPARDNGYSRFQSTVITDEAAWRSFRNEAVAVRGWNHRRQFFRGVDEGAVDFTREALVLLRHTEGSGSVAVEFQPPIVENGHLRTVIKTATPLIGTADMAEYCFALAVSKDMIESISLWIDPAEGEARQVTKLSIGTDADTSVSRPVQGETPPIPDPRRPPAACWTCQNWHLQGITTDQIVGECRRPRPPRPAARGRGRAAPASSEPPYPVTRSDHRCGSYRPVDADELDRRHEQLESFD